MYLTQALHRAGQHHPERIASCVGNCQRTLCEPAERVARWAGALQKFGVHTADRWQQVPAQHGIC